MIDIFSQFTWAHAVLLIGGIVIGFLVGYLLGRSANGSVFVQNSKGDHSVQIGQVNNISDKE